MNQGSEYLFSHPPEIRRAVGPEVSLTVSPQSAVEPQYHRTLQQTVLNDKGRGVPIDIIVPLLEQEGSGTLFLRLQTKQNLN
jgi:hypothetical protein